MDLYHVKLDVIPESLQTPGLLIAAPAEDLSVGDFERELYQISSMSACPMLPCSSSHVVTKQ